MAWMELEIGGHFPYQSIFHTCKLNACHNPVFFSGKSSGGGSANTSRASTPVSERSFKVTPATKRGPNIGKIEFKIRIVSGYL